MWPDVLLGPVVGQVTHDTAVIVLEIETDRKRQLPGMKPLTFEVHYQHRDGIPQPCTCGLKCEVQTINNPAVDASVYRLVVRNLPPNTVNDLFVFQTFMENKKYDGFRIIDSVRVHTRQSTGAAGRGGTMAPPRFVGLSCHDNIVRAGNNPWADLVKTYESDTVFVHLGDQVYLDGIFWRYVRRLCKYADCGADDVCSEANILKECECAMREFYRRSWTATRECRYLLSHFSNVMMADDHEIVNEYGRPSFESSGCPRFEGLVADVAKKLFLQYQDALWLDSDYAKQSRTLTWPLARTLTYDDAVVLFISGAEEGIAPFLNRGLPRALDGAVRDAKNVLVCSAVPPILCSKFETTTWNPARLQTLYKHLHDYMERASRTPARLPKATDKKPFVSIMGGDWHLGVEATMRLKRPSRGDCAFDVALVSVGPLTNFPDIFSYRAVASSAGFATADDGGKTDGEVKTNDVCVETCDKRVLAVWNAGVVDFAARTACVHVLPASWKFWAQSPYYPVLLGLSFQEKKTPRLCCDELPPIK